MATQTFRRLIVSDEVREAFSEKRAVVALESTVITHGLPYPENLKTAQSLEQEISDNDAVPATIAVIDGQIRVGLSPSDLEVLAKSEGVMKVSRRDLPVALSMQKTGGTTVATTMLIAEQAGIRVFATGGIGGVHREAEATFDISADLEELGQTSVCVVCAGAKAVLDIAKTLEVLETKGVPVIGYGCDEFPAFYYRDSGLVNSCRMDSIEEIASLLRHKWNLLRWPDGLTLQGGVLIGNPVPEKDEWDKEEVERTIELALKEMQEKGISGRDVTPFLLARVAGISEGKSMKANIALLKNNARLAAQIAAAL